MKTTKDLLGRARNRIRLVGIELEGGWADPLPPGTELVHDGSVRFAPPKRPRVPEDLLYAINNSHGDEYRAAQARYEKWLAVNPVPPGPGHIGELPSPPMEPGKIGAFLKKFYPPYVNETCGLHVHMSFNTKLTYQRLMTPEYQDTVVDLMGEWAVEEAIPASHRLWARLMGNNEYCRKAYYADTQASWMKKGYNRGAGGANRYTIINYCHGTHGTIECRLLPMFDTREQAQRAIERLLAITNAFVLTQIRKEIAERVEVEDDGSVEAVSYSEAV